MEEEEIWREIMSMEENGASDINAAFRKVTRSTKKPVNPLKVKLILLLLSPAGTPPHMNTPLTQCSDIRGVLLVVACLSPPTQPQIIPAKVTFSIVWLNGKYFFLSIEVLKARSTTQADTRAPAI